MNALLIGYISIDILTAEGDLVCLFSFLFVLTGRHGRFKEKYCTCHLQPVLLKIILKIVNSVRFINEV